MAFISVTNTFANGTTADADQVNVNFTDILNGLSDSTKDISVAAITGGGAIAINNSATFNNSEADKDFRVAAVGATNAFFVQGSNGFIGMGTGTPTANLHISTDTLSSSTSMFKLIADADGTPVTMMDVKSGADLFFQNSSFIIKENGSVGVGRTPLSDFDVYAKTGSCFVYFDNVGSGDIDTGIRLSYGTTMKWQIYNIGGSQGDDLLFLDSGSAVVCRMKQDSSVEFGGSLKVSSLAGSGTRAVVADASGNLSAP